MTETQNIRNFVITAHIDHGKSTLADRFLELTQTVEKRKMKEQYLDSNPLERERGITIKMTPVCMSYKPQAINYRLNLIDTPGHIDFSYEVSRALAAVEGAVLLVDASQGAQAQTLANFELAKNQGLKIIPVINKIDLPQANTEKTKEEFKNLFGFNEQEIILISAKSGENVGLLLEEIIKRIPPPNPPAGGAGGENGLQALIFDYEYSLHQGAIAYIRIFKGEVKKGDELFLANAGIKFKAEEVGIFSPELKPKERLGPGEIGYIITKIKNLEGIRVGETITAQINPAPALPGYKEPKPMIFASLYPGEEGDYEELKKALNKMRLVDNSFYFESERSAILGKGFKTGFLGTLHYEIILERLEREFGQKVIAALPSVLFEVANKKGEVLKISSPSSFPDSHEISKIKEPFLEIEIIAPKTHLGGILQLIQSFYGEAREISNLTAERLKLAGKLPLREFVGGFFDKLKSLTQGFASLNYKIVGYEEAELERMDILINEEIVSAFSRVMPVEKSFQLAKETVEKLADLLPKQVFAYKVQAAVGGRILASRTIAASRKDVAGYLYGGDRTRKMKLWQKQKKGKKRLAEFGKVKIPREVFFKMARA